MFFKLFKSFVYLCCVFLVFVALLSIYDNTMTLEVFIAFAGTIIGLIVIVNIKADDGSSNDNDSDKITAHQRKPIITVSEKVYERLNLSLLISLFLIFLLSLYNHSILVLSPLIGIALVVLKFYVVTDQLEH